MEPIRLFNINTGDPVVVIHVDDTLFNQLNTPKPIMAVQYLAGFISRFNLNPFSYGMCINGVIYSLYVVDDPSDTPIQDDWIPDPDPDDAGFWIPESEQDFHKRYQYYNN